MTIEKLIREYGEATKLGMHPVRETVNPTCGRRVQVFKLSSDQYVTATR
ncbi:hypothetical protein [Nocardia transvalensis]|nr:hypothetical protein [Nocardia transvalensis]